MKKFFSLFSAAATILILASCSSIPPSVSEINRMRHNEPVMSEIPYEAYTAVGRVSGEGSV